MVGADFEALYRAHVGQVYGLCLRLTGQAALAEDCTQDCFIAAWRALPGFEGRSQFSTWLHRIAVNAVLTRRRRGRGDALRDAGELDGEALQLTDGGDAADTIDVERALRRLPPGARDVLVLVGIYGHSHEESAAMLGIAIGTSKAQLHRARRLLATQLGIGLETA
ncbi:MAG TPA: RNA polymerase sigma factor [Steroidobacteraceae bacterium]|nr:RNA polymerase sigma factor [Steroidobacteraceae bacterium]